MPNRRSNSVSVSVGRISVNCVQHENDDDDLLCESLLRVYTHALIIIIYVECVFLIWTANATMSRPNVHDSLVGTALIYNQYCQRQAASLLSPSE